jgi:hypothetical protein
MSGNVSALSEARPHKKSGKTQGVGRAFDKAVRRKPLGRRTRAYAYSMGLKVRCRGAVERGGEAQKTIGRCGIWQKRETVAITECGEADRRDWLGDKAHGGGA